MIKATKKGKHAFAIRSTDNPVKSDNTNKTVPTGGVAAPIIIPKVKKTPK